MLQLHISLNELQQSTKICNFDQYAVHKEIINN